MSAGSRLRQLLRGERSPRTRVHVLVRGRFGDAWHDAEATLALPAPATVAVLLEACDRRAIPLRAALERSSHGRHTLMLNGERCPLDENLERPLAEGDRVFLLGPLAGG